MEEMHSQEVQKRKQLELRQEEERRRREEDMRLHNEDIMRRQQEAGFKGGNFQENVSLSVFFSFSLSISPLFLLSYTHKAENVLHLAKKTGAKHSHTNFPVIP